MIDKKIELRAVYLLFSNLSSKIHKWHLWIDFINLKFKYIVIYYKLIFVHKITLELKYILLIFIFNLFVLYV